MAKDITLCVSGGTVWQPTDEGRWLTVMRRLETDYISRHSWTYGSLRSEA